MCMKLIDVYKSGWCWTEEKQPLLGRQFKADLTTQIPRLKHEDIIYLKPPISGHTDALLTAEKGPAQIMTVFSTLSGKLQNSVSRQCVNNVNHVWDHCLQNFNLRISKEIGDLRFGDFEIIANQFGDLV